MATARPFMLAKASGLNTTPVSTHATREAAEAAMKRKTGGYGSDSMMHGAYTVLDIGPRGAWQYIPASGGFPAILRIRS